MSVTDPSPYFLIGKRIGLRDVRPADVNEAYYRWMNEFETTRYLESRFYPNSLESIRQFVQSKVGDPNNVFLAIVRKDNDQHIGNIKLGPIHWIHRYAEIGLLIGEKSCWGQGYASEAIRLVTTYAFERLNLHKVTAGCYADNQGSEKAFLKAGFALEGVRRSHHFCDGAYVDLVLLGRVRPDQA